MNLNIPRFLTLPELADQIEDLDPTDIELVDVIVETFGLTHDQALTRLAHMDVDALRESLS